MLEQLLLIIKVFINGFRRNTKRVDQFLNGHLPDAMLQELLKRYLYYLLFQPVENII